MTEGITVFIASLRKKEEYKKTNGLGTGFVSLYGYPAATGGGILFLLNEMMFPDREELYAICSQ